MICFGCVPFRRPHQDQGLIWAGGMREVLLLYSGDGGGLYILEKQGCQQIRAKKNYFVRGQPYIQPTMGRQRSLTVMRTMMRVMRNGFYVVVMVATSTSTVAVARGGRCYVLKSSRRAGSGRPRTDIISIFGPIFFYDQQS